MPKVAILKQHEVNGREQFRCNLFPSSALVSVATSLKPPSSEYIKSHTLMYINKDIGRLTDGEQDES